MKKILLVVSILMLVGSAFAFNLRGFYTELKITDGNIFDYVTAAAPNHDTNFAVVVTDVTTGDMISTATNPAQIVRVYQGPGPAGTSAWVYFDAQGFPTAGNVPAGRQFAVQLTYNGNTDPSTNYATRTIVAPSGTGAVFNFGDNAWFLPQTMFGAVTPTDYTISGMFTTTNWDFADINIVATGIDPEDIVINGANYEITVPEGWSGTVTPTKAGFIMDPVNRAYTNVTADIAGENYTIKKDVNPDAPAITFPTPGQIFNWTEAQTVTATWTAPTGFAPEYYEVKFGATDWVSVNQDLSWTTPALGTGDYTFEVRGVINTPQAKSYVPVVARATNRANNNTTRGNGTAASVNFQVIVAVPTFELAITSTPAGAAILLGGIATGNVTPYTVEAAGTYAVELAGYTFIPEDYVWDGLANASIEFVGTEIPTYDVEPDQPVDMDANTEVVISGPGFDGGNIITGEDYTPVPNASFIPTSEGILQLVGTGMVDIDFNFDPAVAWFVYMTGGSWIAVEGPLTTYTVTVDLGAKDATLEFKTGTGEDPTLPVELSVFNAVYTAENFVKLSWITESETNMLGYRVYRAESPVQAEAILITPTMIEATNTSTTQSYNHADYEVEGGHTYYYWLEAVDYSHSSFFGYRAVEVTVNTTPELPEVSAMKSAYPNPFRANSKTNIEVSVKAGETGTVTIYNVLGQVVKTYKVTEGTQIIDWNGRDNKGNACGSGIYFYKMSTPSKNITKKMVIVK
jgi:hypothetical protein